MSSSSLQVQGSSQSDRHARSDSDLESHASSEKDALGQPGQSITFVHRFTHDKSILALAVARNHIYAGSQGGEILVFDLYTFERVHVIEAHNGAVLGFCLSRDNSLLFSSAGDRFVNVWNTVTLEHEASFYSLYDVGDIFCVSYCSSVSTLYMGCQNTAIQWLQYKGDETSRPPNPRSHPSYRQDRFFDSPGPGGIRFPRSDSQLSRHLDHRHDRDLEIPRDNLIHFAHNGYLFAMLLAPGHALGAAGYEVLVTGGGDGLVKLWTTHDQSNGEPRQMHTLDDGQDDGNSVLSLVLEGNFLFCGRSDGKVNVWDLETRQLLRSLRSHRDEALALSTIGGLLYVAHHDGTIKAFSQRQEEESCWKGHAGRVLASAKTRAKNRDLYITGGNDNSVALWDASRPSAHNSESSHASDDKLLDSLSKFVSYRTISFDERYRTDCRRGASWLASILKSLGATTQLLRAEADCNPLVFARFQSQPRSREAKRTILFYGHYDVIAAEDRQKKWVSEPFALTGKDGYLYGRGVSDNKGPIMAAIYAAADLFGAQKLVSDIVFLIEGEEENGSRGFKAAVRQHRNLIGDVDWILLANSYWLDDELPCLTYGLRGVIQVNVEIESDEPDLHSGVDGSSLLDEPLKDLTTLVSSLTGPKRRVQIPGFYDSIPQMTDDERSLYEDITRYLLSNNPSLGTPDTLTNSIIRRTRDPSLTIHRFRTSGSEKSTIIPHYASAAVSLRLVPNQDVDEIATSLAKFLEQQFAKLESKNHLKISINHRAEPWVADYHNEIFKVLETAVTEVWTESSRSQTMAARTRRLSSGHGKSGGLTQFSTLATSSTLAAATSPTSPSLDPERSGGLGRYATADGVAMPHLTLPPANGTDMHRKFNQMNGPGRSSFSVRFKPLYVREGGTIPAVRILEKEFDAPAAHLPCGQASDNAHLDNERFRVLNLLNSREIFRRVFAQLPSSREHSNQALETY